MIDRPIGFEAQYSLVISPRFLHLDGRAKRLATLDLPRGLEPPDGFHWSPDAVSDGTVRTGPLTEAQRAWVVTDLARRFRDAPAYRHSPALTQSEFGVWQLEVATDPLPPTFDNSAFVDRCRALYDTSLRGLLDRGVVGPFPRPETKRQMSVREQINVELWRSGDESPLWKQIAWLCLGLGAQLQQPPPASPRQAVIHQNLRKKVVRTARNHVFCDLFSNGWRIVTAALQDRLRPATLQRWMDQRGTVALLAGSFDHSYCHWYIHGFVPVTVDDLMRAARELPLLRKLKIYTPLPQTLTGEPFPPDEDSWRLAHRIAFHRASLADHIQREPLERAMRTAFFDESLLPGEQLVRLPLFHPRKSWSPGRAWLELRHIHDLKREPVPEWPFRAQAFRLSDGHRVSVHQLEHLLTLGRDVQQFLAVARETGKRLDLLRPDSWADVVHQVRADQLG